MVDARKQVGHAFGDGASMRFRPPLAEFVDDAILSDAVGPKVKEASGDVVEIPVQACEQVSRRSIGRFIDPVDEVAEMRDVPRRVLGAFNGSRSIS